MTSIPVTLKWNKQVFDFSIESSSSFTGKDLKEQIHGLTSVPVDRQKVMVASKPKLWKGMLKDDENFGTLLQQQSHSSALQLTMMGSAQVLKEPATKTEFIEDMTPEERRNVEEQEYQTSLKEVTGMIPALQVLPQHRHQDKHRQADEVYEYNRLVHGLPQYQIENLLQKQKSNENSPPKLTGTPVMTFGLELQWAYVNDLDVLSGGALISGLQDGHVQLWKHGERMRDVIHQGSMSNNSSNGVESVLALKYLPRDNDAMDIEDDDTMPAFCTAGRGTVRLWNSDAEPILAVSSTPLPYASPTGLVQLAAPASSNENNGNFFLGLAARFHVTPPAATNTNRLVPQDEAGRQRLAHIQAQEAMVEQSMDTIRKNVQLWYHLDADKNSQQQPSLQSTMLQAAAPVTALTSWSAGESTILAAGDAQGGIQLWKINIQPQQQQQQSRLQVNKLQYYQLVMGETTQSAIECIKYIQNDKGGGGRLIISTRTISAASPALPQHVASVPIPISVSQAVHVLKVGNDNAPSLSLHMTLNGHKDAVSCLLPLPNGDLITAGGKFDATMKVWSQSQLSSSESTPTELTEASSENLCKDVGYVFALAVLEDFKSSSDEKNPNHKHFAIAAARYNVIKLIV